MTKYWNQGDCVSDGKRFGLVDGGSVLWVGGSREPLGGLQLQSVGLAEYWAAERVEDLKKKRLHSAADDMFKVLLAVEWSASNQYAQAQCPSCRGDELKAGEPRTGHAEGCALDAALRKAGCR